MDNIKIHGKLAKLDYNLILQQREKSFRFWKDFNFKNKKVLEIGSGWGALALNISLCEAKEVIGIDIKKKLIKFSNNMIKTMFPELSNKIKFLHCEITELKMDNFDFIVTENTLEHIFNLKELLSEVKKKLKPNGIFISFFAPLYYSPFGDHRRFHRTMEIYNNIKIPQIFFPWMHLVVPDKILNNLISFIYKVKKKKKKKFNIHSGLNKLKLAQYENIFHKSGLYVKEIKVNDKYFEYSLKKILHKSQYINIVIKILRNLQKIPFLREYFSISITVILEKRI